MPRVTFVDLIRSLEAPGGTTILQCALDMDIKISHVCGGDGACGTCRIEIVEGADQLTPPTMDEIVKEIEEPYRLSCQAKLMGDVNVKIAKIE